MRAHAVELGKTGSSADARELVTLLKSLSPMVRRAAASALGKILDRTFGLAGLLVAPLTVAKRLRTVDEVAVQSKGEKRIGDWLAAKGIAYRYDERMMVAGGLRIRPDFYLPEFDLYIEYWGMETPEYLENKRNKQVLYQREKKKLISLSFRDFDRLEQLLEEKLSRYVPSL